MTRIYGHSDDLVEVEVEGGAGGYAKEYNGNTRLIFGDKDFGGCKVDMTYVKPGVWAARIKQLAEGIPIPWDIIIRTGVGDVGYSVVVEIPTSIPYKTKSLEE